MTIADEPVDIAHPVGHLEQALEELKAGRMIVVTGAADREEHGCLVLAAQFATPQTVGRAHAPPADRSATLATRTLRLTQNPCASKE